MNEIDRLLARQVQGNRSPSVQYVIFDADRVIHSFRAGYADLNTRKEVAADTAYHFYSLTKTFTALAILQLDEGGELDIDHAAVTYLPGFPYLPEITIRQLLTHSAGIPNPLPLRWTHLPEEHESFDRDGFFRQIFARRPRVMSKPNEKFAYSNLGYVLLGQIIESVTGMPYEAYLRTHITEPLGLRPPELGFDIPEPGQIATGYHSKYSISNLFLGFLIDKSKYLKEAEGKWNAFPDFYVNGVSYGGLIGTPAALVRYIREHLKPGCILIDGAHKRMLFTENFTNSGKGTGMCLSWFTGHLNGFPYFTHAGGGGGFYCEIRIYPGPGVGSAVFFNRTGMTDERFLDRVDKYFIKQRTL